MFFPMWMMLMVVIISSGNDDESKAKPQPTAKAVAAYATKHEADTVVFVSGKAPHFFKAGDKVSAKGKFAKPSTKTLGQLKDLVGDSSCASGKVRICITDSAAAERELATPAAAPDPDLDS
jgi:hypothetical protein